VEPLSPEAQVEEANGAIVIRFPPVAPPPFASTAETAAPVVRTPRPVPAPAVQIAPPLPPLVTPSAPPPPAQGSRRAGPRETRPAARKGPPIERDLRRDNSPARARAARDTTPPPAAKRPAERDDAGVALSQSQRRRLRRRKHRDDSSNSNAPGSVAAARPVPPPHGPPPRAASPDERPGSAFVSETAFDVSEAEDAPPWLEDAEVLKSDLIEDEPGEVEVIGEEHESATEAREETDDEAAEDVAEAPAREEDEAPAERGRRRRRRGKRGSRHERPETAASPEAEREPASPAGRGVTVVAPSAEPTPLPPREMVINTVQREECRIAILERGRLEEIYIERAAAENHVGNIYKGIITNVEASIQAAFIDFGQGKNGFLHISDLHPEYFPEGTGQTENVGRKMPRRNRPPIQKCLRRGQQVLVQVTKEGIGTKGPTLSTYLSIPGRFLVMMPGMRRLGVSRRIEDEESRGKLRGVLNELELPEGMGFIARTAALERNKRELQNDLSYLTRLWRAVERRIQSDAAPAELYRESDLVIRTIRDVFTDDIRKIVVDDEEVLTRAREFLSIFSPDSEQVVTAYTSPEPIFHKYGIEAELERLHSRHVPLKSGGSLVIDQTEALVAIDVNSGRFRTEDDAEATAYKINCEAADEIPRQLRLRDLGGVIVCDFIDMRLESHRRDTERRLIENLKKHKERAKVLRTSAFGLIEMTRQRQRASLTRSVYRDCRHCRGTGLVKTIESVTLDVMRLIQLAVTREHIRMVEITVSPEVAYLLQNRKRALINELETNHRRIISIRPEPNFSLDQVEISCTDARGRVVPHT
jgi:ribonuclease E